jgi:multidrug efflux pump subunit AcrA (membrane-fusion protein)
MLNNDCNRIIFKVFSFMLALLQACGNSGGPSEEPVEVKTPVTIVSVSLKPVTQYIDLPAVTMYLNKSIIRASTSGIIEKIFAAPGEIVTPGQLLFTIRTRESAALGKDTVGNGSLAFHGLINISSHKAGVISSVAYQYGDFVMEGDELAELSDRSSLVFILDVPMELQKFAEKARTCSITLADGKKINGTFSGILPEMDIQSQTVRYIVRPESPLIQLPANMISNASIVKSVTENANMLPKEAVLSNETETEFWIMMLTDDSTAVKVPVIKGYENNEEVEITDPPLKPSDRIILTGSYGMPDTARISVLKGDK